MENADTTQSCSSIRETQDVKNTDSAENFQKFIYELFENNGVINDLRAYLRGHIVEVLRCAQTGEPPTCQKHFTQRLELPLQALNILILEYLLRMEFSYSLSVFISEIPLANMVFGYARSMMQAVDRDPTLKFINEDIWSILNYLGIKCDSEHAMNVVEMYNGDKNPPLLLCILQCMPMYKEYKEPIEPPPVLVSSQESVISDNKPMNPEMSADQECKHYSRCQTCREKVHRIRDRYRRKKMDLVENMKEFNINTQNVDSLLKNIDYTERNIIDEMFQQVKAVYEAEVEMLKTDVDSERAACAQQLQQRTDEMEEQYKSRSQQLERNIEKKKKFLWGLARSLRDQHRNINTAMDRVREETDRLAAKEDSLKSQMAEAEQMLRQRGEDMRIQITNELQTLEGHLQSMKKERDAINKERSELELIKIHKSTNIHTEYEELRNHYDSLKNEFQLLKSYLASAKLEPKCVMEKGTDMADVVNVLNNGHDLERRSDERIKPKQLVNDLKKQKNVNFSQSNVDEYRSRSPSRSRSSASSEAGDASAPRDVTPCAARCDVTALHDDNNRLRLFVAQQGEQLEALARAQAELQAELQAQLLLRPRTAPPDTVVLPVNTSASNPSHGWKKGAGEELSFLASSQPRIVLPGDDIPFIGVVRDRHDYRRHMINQWRALRRRTSPVAVSKRSAQHFIERHVTRTPPAGFRINEEDRSAHENSSDNPAVIFNLPREQYQERPKTAVTEVRTREKSPKSVLREAKEKLKTNAQIIKDAPLVPREKSPSTVLREAKLRLKKLEIEAEAVEKSYLDFRKKRQAQKTEQSLDKNDGVQMEDTDAFTKRSLYKLDETAVESTSKDHKPRYTAKDFDPYIQQYCANYDIGPTHFKNKNAAYYQVTPIPKVYSDSPKEKLNFLETPLTEFRKYYTSDKRPDDGAKDRPKSPNESTKYSRSPVISQISHCISRPLTPILKNTSESSSRARIPVQITIEHSVMKQVDNPDSASLTKSLIIKSIKDHSSKSVERPEDTSPTRSLISTSIKDHSIIKTLDDPDISRAKSPVLMNIDDVSVPNNLRSPNTSVNSRSRSPSVRENSESKYNPTIDNQGSSSGNSDRSNNLVGGTRKEVIRQAKHDKVKELQILEQNIKKIYNLPEQSNLDNESSEGLKWQENNRKSYVFNYEQTAVDTHEKISESKQETDKNLLRIEVESTSDDVKNSESKKSQDLLFIVESTIDGNNPYNIASDIESEKLPPKMTIIVSPKRSETKRLEDHCGVKEQKLSEHDVLSHIYQGSPMKDISSVQMQLELSQVIDDTITELEQNEDPDYPDDFSADVDNYNSRSDVGNRSRSPTPISMAKTSEDDNFWDLN